MLFFIAFAAVLMIPVGIYLYVLVKRMLELFFGPKKKRLQKTAAAAAAVILTVPSINLFGLWALVVLYFAALSACADIVRLLLKRAGCRQRRQWSIAYRSGAAAAAVTALILGYAYFNMHHVVATRYTVATEKEIRPEGYRIIFISDLHFATTMDKKRLAAYCGRIEEEKPDLVVLGGDIVDERSSAQEVRDAFGALGQISSTFGTYYVYGNHDKGRYARNRDFTTEQLTDMIQNSKVSILQDETIILNEELTITGRKDRSDASLDQNPRALPGVLLEQVSKESYHIIADHQPRGMQENAQAGYDLMLSGHTHAGQMWPVGLITELFDRDTVNYGQKSFGNLELIVSSGIAGWGYPLRTGRHSEYVVLQVRGT